ncbi:MAG TPA: histidine phosphatase family protein [Gemmatimonadaceae bacterium]|nr:histidine phosphatase family protein [Gemmatimonadaceae bacterium]
MLLHALLALSLHAPQTDSLISADSAFTLMRRGGYTMIWRHAETDWLTQDAPGAPDRALQRNLTARGVTDAKAVGEFFKRTGIPVSDVVSSQMWRTRETGEHAFGRVRVDSALRSMDQTAEQKTILAAAPAKGTNRVLVTHHFVIERNVPGIRPGMVNEGEAVIVRPSPRGIQLVSIVKLSDWEKATHGVVVASRTAGPAPSQAAASEARPALHGAFQLLKGGMSSLRLIHDDRYINVMRYMEAYNSGEGAMRNFFEKRAVADSSRPIEQRLETYRQLRSQLGALTLDGAELRGEEFVLQTRRAVAKEEAVQLTFRFEKNEPYRMISLSFARTSAQ